MINNFEQHEINSLGQKLLNLKAPPSLEELQAIGRKLTQLAPLPQIIEIDYAEAEQKILAHSEGVFPQQTFSLKHPVQVASCPHNWAKSTKCLLCEMEES